MFWPFLLLGSRPGSQDDEGGLEITTRDQELQSPPGRLLPNVDEHNDDDDSYGNDEGFEDDDDDDHTVHRESRTSSSSPPKWYRRLQKFFQSSPSQPDLDEFIPNYRYTPILSGVFIPFSILLEIPGLTEDWYIRTIENKITETKPNTVILDVAMALSMASAVMANVCLIGRFLERRVKSMTLACIFFLTIHDIINIITVTVFGVEHSVDDGFTYGQAFWMTVCSTIASTFTNVTLIIDFWRTPDFSKSGSGLTHKQRSLVIIVIILLCYIAFGALVHTYLLGQRFINALYFTVVTIETVGLGDITPSTTGGRVFVCFYAAFGVVNLALAVGLARETVLEAMEVSYRKRLQSVRTRRRELHKQTRAQIRWRQAVEWRLKEAEQPLWIKDEDIRTQTRLSRWFHAVRERGLGHRVGDAYSGSNPHGMHLNLEALTNAQLESAALEAGVPLSTLLPPDFWSKRKEGLKRRSEKDTGLIVPHPNEDDDIPLTHARIGRMVAMLGNFALAVYRSGTLAGDAQPATAPPRQRTKPAISSRSYTSRDQFATFQEEVDKEELRAFYASLTVAWSLFIVFWVVGTAIFHVTEGWPFGATMYFCFMAFMTIGYGDFAPETPTGRSIFVVWALLGIATMTILISIVSEAYTYRYKTMLRSRPFQKAVKRYRAEKARHKPPPFGQEQPAGLSEGIQERLGRSDEHANEDELCSSIRGEAMRKRKGNKDQDVQARLEALPKLILEHTRMFQEHVRYFTRNGTGNANGRERDRVPEGVRALVDDIAGTEKLGERMKSEMLQDDDSRQTLFALGIEEEIRKIVRIAEDTLRALEERDGVAALRP